MTMFSEATLFSQIRMGDRYGSSGTAFALVATLILVGLAVLSIVSGVAPAADPAMLAP